jgi:hypothetical protein
MIITNYNELLPEGILFSIRQINDMGLIKSDLLKKLIYSHKIEVVKLNSKNFISRTALVSYLESQTISVDGNY